MISTHTNLPHEISPAARTPQTWRSPAILGVVVITISIAGYSCRLDSSQVVSCSDGLLCPPGWKCAASQSICILDPCGDGEVNLEIDEQCDDGNLLDGDGCDQSCKLENCGDGILQSQEVCDDGNKRSGDGCREDCLSDERCGNGLVDEAKGEQCDDGNGVDNDGCSVDCKLESCGDGILQLGESCDTGGEDTAECDFNCSLATCGDGYLNPLFPGDIECDEGEDTENCDSSEDCTFSVCGDGYTNFASGENCDGGVDENGDVINTATCDEDCTVAECGDGFRNEEHRVEGRHFERCDEGGNTATCDSDCSLPRCGDRIHNPQHEVIMGQFEECEARAVNTPTCNFNCTTSRCGDGVLNREAGEYCERIDGAFPANCDPVTCKLEICSGASGEICCGNNQVDPFEVCDDGLNNGSPSSTCAEGCQRALCQQVGRTADCCGNGMLEFREACDPGSAGELTNCDFDCTRPRCGDNVVNRAAGEECDDGNTTLGDGCGKDEGGTVDYCKLPRCGIDGLNDFEQCDDGNQDDGDGCSSICRDE